MALFVNLLMAAAAGWILVGDAKLAGHKLDPKWVALVAAALAVVFTAYGVWKAWNPQLHRIEVALEDLPEGWRNRRVVQLSDIHLGHIHGTAFMERVARKVNALEPEMVFITGDVFDGLGGDYPSFVPAINSLEARQGVFFVPGNHELYSGAAPLLGQYQGPRASRRDSGGGGIASHRSGVPGAAQRKGARADSRRALHGEARHSPLLYTNRYLSAGPEPGAPALHHLLEDWTRPAD